ncbi:ubiquinone biosynthesis methyltransferase UbiE [Photorhabdus luminescens subsp. luminescens]|uniref:Methyltransferase domain-containing protein n=1 Tax=Photorhabdus luminescens TaxID=29488 RepID=A0A1G5Q8H7_PHOLU|nr:class I SAM-dependent methyltransferase [Photorhabdus luminescens]KMW74260.1 ubiquinone biosynthesis methyltransferase UbiE [Photorhabdus luminescens subsp. luminescens]SCZ57691.1 Methyltransferase domain-containing protein [Photorhabdus luminescens]
MKDDTLYDPIAHLYESFSDAAAHIKVEIRTIFNLAGDIHGKSVLDLACGYGLFSREYKNRGASKVIGVDISENMIAIAKSKSQQYGDDIEFHVRDVCKMESFGKFDIVNAAWLFCHAESIEDLETMFRVIAAHLKPSGKLIAYTAEPDCRLAKVNYENYGIKILSEEPVKDTTLVRAEFLTTPPSPFTMYLWSREQYQAALQKAGFKQFRWQKPMLLESDIEDYPLGFWDDYQRNCLDTALVCQF